jgi:hypothetical protein
VPPETSGGNNGIFNWTLDLRYLYSGATPVQFESSQLERQLRHLQQITSAGAWKRRDRRPRCTCCWATIKEPHSINFPILGWSAATLAD